MKTIQITIEPSLLKQIDSQCQSRNRSAFFRQAAELLLKQMHLRKLEQQQQHGYKKHPVRPGEFDVWQTQQVWTE